MSKPQNNNNLKRQLSPIHVWALVFGCIIVWGAFINPRKKCLPNSAVAGTAIAMELVMIIIAFSYAYMTPKRPKACREFTFSKECFGKNAAFLCGWFLIAAYLTNVPINSTAIGLIVDEVDSNANILKFGFHYELPGLEVFSGEIIIASAILIFSAFINIFSVKKRAYSGP